MSPRRNFYHRFIVNRQRSELESSMIRYQMFFFDDKISMTNRGVGDINGNIFRIKRGLFFIKFPFNFVLILIQNLNRACSISPDHRMKTTNRQMRMNNGRPVAHFISIFENNFDALIVIVNGRCLTWHSKSTFPVQSLADVQLNLADGAGVPFPMAFTQNIRNRTNEKTKNAHFLERKFSLL